jgi:5-methylcytosine-specific restriction endonuclease McrA
MKRISFDPQQLTPEQKNWWDEWIARSEEQTKGIIAAYKKGDALTHRQAVWADLKTWLLDNVFHGKCAYCEAPISGSFFGEGEHYRPKGKVTIVQAGKKVAVIVGGTSHPGYFWLAYDWKNLVPACQECNNRKSDLFPTARDHVCVPSPSFDQLDADEDPLLLHPYRDETRKYLLFGLNGVITAIDDNDRGVNTIKTFGLDREALAERRKKRQEQTLAYMMKILPDVIEGKTTLPAALDLYVGVDAEYSAAAQDIVNAELPKIVQRLTQIKI